MNWQNTLPTALSKEEQIILLEAESGDARRKTLQHWVAQKQQKGVVSRLLSCDRAEGGPWAGLRDWLNDVIPDVQIHAPDLMIKHDYELASVLPTLQRTLAVRNPTLTDSSPNQEKVRNYPADRAYRIVHGLIDFLSAWYQDRAACVIIACDRYDYASPLVRRFFGELMRRRGQFLNLVLLTAVDLGRSEVVTNQFEAKYFKHCVQLRDLVERNV